MQLTRSGRGGEKCYISQATKGWTKKHHMPTVPAPVRTFSAVITLFLCAIRSRAFSVVSE